MPFAHTPYDGSTRPFTIGVAPIDVARWIEPDELLAPHLDEKERLLAARPHAVFRETDGSRDAQAEALGLLVAHLAARFPRIYQQAANRLHIAPCARSVGLDEDAAPPLLTAARLVQEDLCLMRRDAGGWRLAAASLCFPSGWSLAEKIGQDLAAIHAPVPGFAGRMEGVVARIFDNLRPDALVERFNWSLYGDGRLHRAPDVAPNRFAEDLAETSLRIERQTLRRLPRSAAILFTIRVHADPVARLASHPRGRELAAGLRAQLLALSEEQARYKGLAGVRGRIAATLAAIAGA